MKKSIRRKFIASLDDFTLGYLECMLFTSDEREFPEYCYSGPFSADSEDFARFDWESLKKIAGECMKFQNDNHVLLRLTKVPERYNADNSNGADFCYSRCGCGVGFRDRAYDYGYPKTVADQLHEAARAYGEIYLHKHREMIYVG